MSEDHLTIGNVTVGAVHAVSNEDENEDGNEDGFFSFK